MVQFVAILLVVGSLNPAVFIPTAPIAAVFVGLRHYYLRSARQIKRLEAAARSPVFTHISASLNGLATIRAFGAEADVLANFHSYLVYTATPIAVTRTQHNQRVLGRSLCDVWAVPILDAVVRCGH